MRCLPSSRGGARLGAAGAARRAALPTLANPLHLSATPVRYGRASPALDGDRDSVLRDWLGQG